MTKNLKLVLAAFVMALSTLSLKAQTDSVKKETVKVWGNCGMCQSKIEKAAKAAGAITAKWDEETDILEVSYDAAKTSIKNIEEKVASVGYDTKNFSADTDVYSKLPGCCKYERKTASTPAAKN